METPDIPQCGDGKTQRVDRGATVRVRVLDVVAVGSGSNWVTIGSPQQSVILTLLVANKGRTVTLDAIADELWPDVRPQRWRGCIATLTNSLRTAAGDRDFVCSTGRGYTLHRRPEAVSTDVEELQDSLQQAYRADEQGLDDVAESMARRALQIYGTGPWTTDYWGWNEAAAEAARLLATVLLRRGALLRCISELSPAMEDFDWHDGLWACLIYAHHQLGSTRRGLDLMQRAKLAVGGATPALQNIESRLSAAPSLDQRVAIACSA